MATIKKQDYSFSESHGSIENPNAVIYITANKKRFQLQFVGGNQELTTALANSMLEHPALLECFTDAIKAVFSSKGKK